MPKIENFIAVAKSVAAMSKDQSTKVGAIAIDGDWNILCVGFNGFPRGVSDDPSRYEDKKTKYALISHAEANLVAQAARNGIALKGSTVIITSLPPCSSCTKSLIQAGVREVWFPELHEEMSERWIDEWEWSKLMLVEAGVRIGMYKEEQ